MASFRKNNIAFGIEVANSSKEVLRLDGLTKLVLREVLSTWKPKCF